jgi:hypothetical protein
VKVLPLPLGAFVMGNYFPATDDSAGKDTSDRSAESNDGVTPPPPVFRDLQVVEQEIKAAVKPIKVPSAIATPHPIVARLLKQDEDRKASDTQRAYLSEFYGPKFIKRIQQRRLRIMSCIFVELERLGCKIRGNTHAGEVFSIKIGGQWTHIRFGVEGGRFGEPFYRRRGNGVKGEQLRFDITDHDPQRSPPKRTWTDGGKSLEYQATDILCGILLNTEEEARKNAMWRYNYELEAKARRLKEAKLAEEKRIKERIERNKMMAEARIKRLIEGSDALEKAARIRRYVAGILAESATLAETITPDVLNAWARWALAEADQIDPVLSRRFLADMEMPEASQDQ